MVKINVYWLDKLFLLTIIIKNTIILQQRTAFVKKMFKETIQTQIEATNKYVAPFLILNGFERKGNYFFNDKCSIELNYENSHYTIRNTIPLKNIEGGFYETYSSNLNLMWLIGFLTYNGLMEKEYKQEK